MVQTRHDRSLKRGAVVKALAICSPIPCHFAFQDLLNAALDDLLRQEDDTIEILQRVYETINSVELSKELDPHHSFAFRRRTCCARKDNWGKIIKAPGSEKLMELNPGNTFEDQTKRMVLWNTQRIPILVVPNPHDGMLMGLIQTFEHEVMHIYRALRANRRILILGAQAPAGTVCQAVLATHALRRPISKTRLFPYVPLGHEATLLNCPNYVAGVTNPVFQFKTELWDVCCDLATGEVEPGESRLVANDRVFLSRVMDGISQGFSEEWVQVQFDAYTVLDRAKDKDLLPNMPIWTQYIRALHSHECLDEDQVERMYQHFVDLLVGEQDLQDFLTRLPDTLGGLHVIAQGLLHPSRQVQRHTAQLFQRLEQFPSTRDAVLHLNQATLSSYHAVLRKTQIVGNTE